MANDKTLNCFKLYFQDVSRKTVFAVIDVQNDFISGSLALNRCPAGQDGYEVVPIINNILNQGLFDLVAYTLDWHPSDHCSFIDNVSLYPVDASSPISAKEAKVFDTIIHSKPVVLKQKLWPSHCLQESWGAELHKELKVHVCSR
jgi:exosome complex component RRP4